MKSLQIFKKLGYLVVIIVIVGGYFFFLSQNKEVNSAEKLAEKVSVEIGYMESRITKMLNLMNNISYDDYKLSTIEVKSEENEQGDEEDYLEIYQLIKETDINQIEVDWEELENVLDEMYVSSPIFTLDLYEIGVSSQIVNDFNKGMDELKISILDETRVQTLVKLVKLYDVVTQIAVVADESSINVYLMKVKLDIFLAYIKLEDNSFSQMEKYVQDAVNVFNELYLKYDMLAKKNVSINKCLVQLNELLYCIELEEGQVFLYKYKNLMEEIEKILK